MAAKDYSLERKCECGVSIVNTSARCTACHNRTRRLRKLEGRATRENDYRLGLRCESCGGRRNDRSKKLCWRCRTGEPLAPAVRMVISPWEVLPDGTRMRTITGSD